MSAIFGERLRLLRNKEQILQKELAADLNVDQRTISAWEHNLQEPKMEMIVKIAQYFFTTPNYLLGFDDKEIY